MKERLHKVIAASGLVSRRAAEASILAGKVTVNGKKITTLGSKADPEIDIILVNGISLPIHSSVTYLVNKPVGVVCTRISQGSQKIVTELVPSSPSVYPVGRLDKNSEGLILLTNNGELANRLTHPSFAHSKKYTVWCTWNTVPVARRQLLEKIQKGVMLEDGLIVPDAVSCKEEVGTVILTVTIHEGRHHLVRRMCAALGLKVIRLVRVQLAHLTLSGVQSGRYRILSNAEIDNLLHDPS